MQIFKELFFTLKVLKISNLKALRIDTFFEQILMPILNTLPIGVNLGKAQAAFCIIKEWSEQQKSEGKDVTLDVLRKTFPIEYNPYYASKKWFNHLFYEDVATPEYDGTEAIGPVQGNWDFDKKKRFNIDTTDNKKVTMLKMWRKDSLEYLIKMVAEKKLFNGTLDVVPVE